MPLSAGSPWNAANSEKMIAPPTAAMIQNVTCQPALASSKASVGAMMEEAIPPADC